MPSARTVFANNVTFSGWGVHPGCLFNSRRPGVRTMKVAVFPRDDGPLSFLMMECFLAPGKGSGWRRPLVLVTSACSPWRGLGDGWGSQRARRVLHIRNVSPSVSRLSGTRVPCPSQHRPGATLSICTEVPFSELPLSLTAPFSIARWEGGSWSP